MALIDFKCGDCGEKFDEFVNSSNKDNIQCPKCRSKNIKQIFEGRWNACGTGKGSGGCSSGNCSGCSGCH